MHCASVLLKYPSLKMLLLLLLGSVGLSWGAEICSPPCGCFNDNPPFDDRPLPETWETQNLQFILHTPGNQGGVPITDWNNIPSIWQSNRPTIFMIHGWNSNPGTWNGVRGAFFDRGHDVNIVSVDWSGGAGHLWYPTSASNTRVVGSCAAVLAQNMVNRGSPWSRIHCIGHSLGGHTCGSMGKGTSGRIGRISGLDPAGPWFDDGDPRVRLDRNDGVFVDNIHTDAGGLGVGQSIGHIDFFPHNGRDQPPCGSDGVCGHGICKDYYEHSIRSTSCNFWSRPCATEGDGNAGNCNPSGCSGSPCGKMGYYATTSTASGRHYLTTTASAPYCAT